MIELAVNGQLHHLALAPEVPLLFALRNHLGLYGAKLGCGLEQCGSCKVLVDGVPAFSCNTPVGALAGKQIQTLEGLATGQALNPVQQALLARNAAQCGYCIGGIVISATALFADNPTASDSDIRAALKDHLCRCGAQPRILAALNDLAQTYGRVEAKQDD